MTLPDTNFRYVQEMAHGLHLDFNGGTYVQYLEPLCLLMSNIEIYFESQTADCKKIQKGWHRARYFKPSGEILPNNTVFISL